MKTEETPAVWNSEDPVDNHKVSVTAMWITDGKPKYFEGIPAGDYILEELEAPTGYLPADGNYGGGDRRAAELYFKG